MNVIFHPAHDHGLAIELDQNSAKITVQFVPQNLVAQKRAAVFG
jgi:hypothetical protein